MKKILSFVLMVCMVLIAFTAVPTMVSAALSSPCGKNLTRSLSDDGVLTISGTGGMNYSSDVPQWYHHRSSIKSVTIENGVTSIGDDAFYKSSRRREWTHIHMVHGNGCV